MYRDSEKPRKGFVAQNKRGKTHFCSVKRYFPKLEFKISSEMKVAPRNTHYTVGCPKKTKNKNFGMLLSPVVFIG